MKLCELSTVLIRVLAIGFAGEGITSIGFNVLQVLTLLGIGIGKEHDSFNWYALLWHIAPLLQFSVAATLWFFAPRIAHLILDFRNNITDESDAH